MLVDGKPYRAIWTAPDGRGAIVIDQTRLPHAFVTRRLFSVADAARAIADMTVRGAPLIGATAAHGLALAMAVDPGDDNLTRAVALLAGTRPTAINLRNMLDEVRGLLAPLPAAARAARALAEAERICDREVEICRAIGRHGMPLVAPRIAGRPVDRANPVRVLTHCNAGWLACVDLGTALAPIYAAHDSGVPVHVWVDETRPRNQGSSLTAWELGQHGVPHTIVTDNAGGILMQRGEVDLCLVGTDRTTANGDVCNKVGTYLKALAARDNGVPFYVALPSTSIDWNLPDGAAIPIEERGADEVAWVHGMTADGTETRVRITPNGAHVGNPAFDVTPARLVTALITERGTCAASSEGLGALFPAR